MLGEHIGEFRGQSIGTRVLPDEGRGPRMEVTDHGHGTLYGVPVSRTVTYMSVMRPNGTITAEGTGMVTSETGDTATFRGFGVGRFVGAGASSWRGTMIFETESEKLAGLNGIAVLFEFEVDASGKSEGNFTEWK